MFAIGTVGATAAGVVGRDEAEAGCADEGVGIATVGRLRVGLEGAEEEEGTA